MHTRPTATTAPAASRWIPQEEPIRISWTLGPFAMGVRGGDPTMRVAPDAAWWARRTPLGPVTTAFHREQAGVVVEAWGPGTEWALETAPALLGCDDDWTGFVPHHPSVARAHHQCPGLRLPKSGLVTDSLVQTILAQKVTGIEAKRTWRRMVHALGEPAPGPFDLHLPPTPATLAAQPYERFHPFGLERRRADVIRQACRRIDRLQEAVDMTPSEAFARLTALPGIGPWTAGLVMRLAMGDPDAVEIGDYHVKDMVAYNLAGEPRGTDARMLELLAPYAGHRGRVVRLLEVGGARKPAYGARMEVRDIRHL